MLPLPKGLTAREIKAVLPFLGRAYAQWEPPENPLPEKWGSLSYILKFAARVVFTLGLGLVIIFMILSGIKWVTAGGDKEAAEAAKKQLTNTVIGLVIIAGVYAIINLIVNLLGGEITQWWPEV